MESWRSLRESVTMCWSFFETALRNCCSVISMPYLRALRTRSLFSSCLTESSIFSTSCLGDDCLAAIRAAAVITLDLSLSSKGFSFFGIPLGMVVLFYQKSVDLSTLNYKRVRMNTKMGGKEAMRILKKHGITRDEFANMMGIKRSTMRTCIYGNRISAKMVSKLMEMESEEEVAKDLAEVDEMIEEVKREVSVVEGIVRQNTGNPATRMGKIYAVPQNRFLRLVEFADGSHGKFRCKSDQHLKLGEMIELKHSEKDIWEVVRG